MKTFRTKGEHQVPYHRKIVSSRVYLRITEMTINSSGVLIRGHYYIKTEKDPYYILDEIYPSVISWDVLASIEKRLPEIQHKQYFLNVMMQRISELTQLKLKVEGLSNYNIPPQEWEEDEKDS